MITIRDFLELVCDDSLTVILYDMNDSIEDDAKRSVKAECYDLLHDWDYDLILDYEIDSWEYCPTDDCGNVLEINYTSD